MIEESSLARLLKKISEASNAKFGERSVHNLTLDRRNERNKHMSFFQPPTILIRCRYFDL
jgi:hypothetical protein